MKREIKPIQSKLSAAEIQRAIYIDYEGNMHAAPTLLGWRVDGQNHAAIVESGFADCAGRYRAKHVTANRMKFLFGSWCYKRRLRAVGSSVGASTTTT